jgi:hypothetical protein
MNENSWKRREEGDDASDFESFCLFHALGNNFGFWILPVGFLGWGHQPSFILSKPRSPWG